jgi:hypothetical protein
VFSAESTADIEDLTKKVLEYVESVKADLSLYPPANIVNNEKKEILRNLHESGMSEDIIAEQLDLDLNMVKMLIEQM